MQQTLVRSQCNKKNNFWIIRQATKCIQYYVGKYFRVIRGASNTDTWTADELSLNSLFTKYWVFKQRIPNFNIWRWMSSILFCHLLSLFYQRSLDGYSNQQYMQIIKFVFCQFLNKCVCEQKYCRIQERQTHTVKSTFGVDFVHVVSADNISLKKSRLDLIE